MELSVTIDDKQVRAMLRRAPSRLRSTLVALLGRAAIVVQRLERAEAPVGVTGDFRRSIGYKVNDASLTAEIAPQSKIAIFIEEGTRPHWTSVKDGTSLAKWADFFGINRYALQHSIAKKGTKANDFVGRTGDQAIPKVRRIFDSGIAGLAQELNNG